MELSVPVIFPEPSIIKKVSKKISNTDERA
jgi:hypothetical protein